MLKKILSAAAIGASLVAVSAVSASAAIVCQGSTCWHVHDAYQYPHEAGIVVHKTTGTGVRMKNSHSASTRAAATGAAENGSHGDLIAPL